LLDGVPLDASDNSQFSLFDTPASQGNEADAALAREIRERIKGFDINVSTPLDALQLLKSLQDRLKQ
jgi:hypothetical protein